MEFGKKSWSYFQRGEFLNEVSCKNFICEQKVELYIPIQYIILATNTEDALCSFDIVVINNIIIV